MPRHFEQITAGRLDSRQVGSEAVVYDLDDRWSIRGNITRVDQEKMVEADWNFNEAPKPFSSGSWRVRVWFDGLGSSIVLDPDSRVYLVSGAIDPEEPILGEVVEEQPEIAS